VSKGNVAATSRSSREEFGNALPELSKATGTQAV